MNSERLSVIRFPQECYLKIRLIEVLHPSVGNCNFDSRGFQISVTFVCAIMENVVRFCTNNSTFTADNAVMAS